MTISTYTIQSGFRHHPLDQIHPFFVQASLGVMLLKPSSRYAYPRYAYKTYTELSTGWLFDLEDTGICLVPTVGLKTTFMEEALNEHRLGGFNQIELGIKAGYKF